jgi:long-chain acyl-CoA synthetase
MPEKFLTMVINKIFPNLSKYPDKTIKGYFKGGVKTIKYSELFDNVKRIAAFLRLKGVRKGDYVAIYGENSFEWITIDLACMYLGAITAPLDTKQELGLDIIEGLNLKIVFSETSLPDERIISISKTFEILDGFDESFEFHKFSIEESYTLISTSGSTGPSKFIEVRTGAFENLVSETVEKFNITSQLNFVSFLPLYTYLERVYVYSSIIYQFNLIVTSVEYLFPVLKREDVNFIIGVPLLYESLQDKVQREINKSWAGKFYFSKWQKINSLGLKLKFPPLKKVLGKSMKYMLCGAAPIKKQTLKFFDSLGFEIYEGYGLSEMANMATLNYPGSRKIGSVGKVFSNAEMKILDDGELCFKSDFFANSKYYYSMEENTVYKGDWLHTGDLGYQDDEGYVFINGRKNDLIVLSSGKNIYPVPIEKLIESSDVVDMAVVFDLDKEVLVAVVCLAEGMTKRNLNDWMVSVNEKLDSTAKIKNTILADESFSVKNGFLSSTLKKKRKLIIEKYKLEISRRNGNENN